MSFTIADILKNENDSKKTISDQNMNNQAINYSTDNRTRSYLVDSMMEAGKYYDSEHRPPVDSNYKSYQRSLSEADSFSAFVRYQNLVDFQRSSLSFWSARKYQGK